MKGIIPGYLKTSNIFISNRKIHSPLLKRSHS